MTSDGPVDRPIISTVPSQAISIALTANMQIPTSFHSLPNKKNTDRERHRFHSESEPLREQNSPRMSNSAMVAVAICCILVLLAVFIVIIIVVGQTIEEPK